MAIHSASSLPKHSRHVLHQRWSERMRHSRTNREQATAMETFRITWRRPLREMGIGDVDALGAFVIAVGTSAHRTVEDEIAEQRTPEAWLDLNGFDGKLPGDVEAICQRIAVTAARHRKHGGHEVASELESFLQSAGPRLLDVLRHPAPAEISSQRRIRGRPLDIPSRAVATVLAREIHAHTGTFPSPPTRPAPMGRRSPGRPREAEEDAQTQQKQRHKQAHQKQRERWGCFAHLGGVIARGIDHRDAPLNWQAAPLSREVLLVATRHLTDLEGARTWRDQHPRGEMRLTPFAKRDGSTVGRERARIQKAK